ncbi:MAG TPA: hypothetical protein VGN11_05060 [Candidatus Baltobacteraceae bacterium]|nr:hypothetical protein [Candidatus Baltobacteraceae bacterium]
MGLEHIVDVERYMARERRDGIVERGRRQLAEIGSATFDDFILPAALRDMVNEANTAQPHAYRREASYTAYMPDEATGDENHPTRRMHPYALSAIANDQLDPAGILNALYRDERFIRFIADILQEPELYPLGDPMLGLTLTYLRKGDQHGWHFDRNDFVVSLLLQGTEEGGVFEFAPFIRSDNDPNYEAVDAAMNGDDSRLHRIKAKAGTLALFAGKRSLHHVTPILGDTPRIIALLSYDRTSNLIHDEAVHLRTFGRSLQAH